MSRRGRSVHRLSTRAIVLLVGGAISLATGSCSATGGASPPATMPPAVSPAAQPTPRLTQQDVAFPAPSLPPATMPAQTPTPAEVAVARQVVETYTADLVGGAFGAAWALLALDSPTKAGTSFGDWVSERGAFFESVAGQYNVVTSPTEIAPITEWVGHAGLPAIDLRHAVLVEVAYPLIAESNQWNAYIVVPGSTGPVIYEVR